MGIGLRETACRRVTHGTTSCRYDRRSREPTSRPAGDYLQSEPLRSWPLAQVGLWAGVERRKRRPTAVAEGVS